MDRLQAMETFVRVVEAGSFSRAAHVLHIGQPAVSKAVAALEERLGVRLLLRSTRTLRTTEAGQAFYERARLALDEAEQAEAAARGIATKLDGTLRVCAPVTFGRLHLAPRLGEFLTLHPKVQLDVVMDDRNIDLLGESIDIALRMGALADSSLTARRLAQSPRLLIASRNYLERHGIPRSPADLLGHHAVLYSQPGIGSEWMFRRGTAETSVRVPSRLSFTAAEGLREAVIAGAGLSVASRWMFSRELDSGAVVPLLEEWQLSPIDLWALFPGGRRPSAKARAFVDWFAAVIAPVSGDSTLASDKKSPT
jgi:DNA-binding transcriptional LysR family regulator